MKKKILKVLLCGLMAAALSGCSIKIMPDAIPATTGVLEKIWSDDNMNSLYVFEDEKTGVNYIIYNGYNKGGITPRYNADGSLYVTYTK